MGFDPFSNDDDIRKVMDRFLSDFFTQLSGGRQVKLSTTNNKLLVDIIDTKDGLLVVVNAMVKDVEIKKDIHHMYLYMLVEIEVENKGFDLLEGERYIKDFRPYQLEIPYKEYSISVEERNGITEIRLQRKKEIINKK